MTGLTKINIISLTGLTLMDDTVLPSGATFKIAVEFPTTFKGFRYDIEVYENQERFEAGDAPLELKDFVSNGEYYLGNNLPQINILAIYYMVTAFISSQYDVPVAKVITEFGEI